MLGGGVQTPEKTGQLNAALRDFNRTIDENADLIGDAKLVKDLKNPIFDGSGLIGALADQEGTTIGQPSAMQGNLFGGKAAANGATLALAQAGGDHDAAVQLLEARRQKVLDAAAKGEHDAAWAINRAEMFKMSRPEAAKNPEAVSAKFVENQLIRQLQK